MGKGLLTAILGLVFLGVMVLVLRFSCQATAPVPGRPDGGLRILSSQAGQTTVVDADLIRVGISDDSMEAYEYPLTRLTATGPYEVQDKSTGNVVFSAEAGQPVEITVDSRGFFFQAGQSYGPVNGPLVLKPKGSLAPQTKVQVLNITRRGQVPSYRGYLEILRGYSSPKKLTVVNVLPLQEYLKAVVPNELPPHYGYEAVKAQSVAARNYAIRPREKPYPQFDMCDSQACQVYLGAQTEHPTTNRSLIETDGLVALYQGEPILALYSSAHGGYSENYENAFSDPRTNQFPAKPVAYLSGHPDVPQAVHADLSTEVGARQFWLSPKVPSFDVNSSYYRWEKRWPAETIQSVLKQSLLAVSKDTSTKPFVKPLFGEKDEVGLLKRVVVTRRGVSGKAMEVALETSTGRWVLSKEFVIRKVFRYGNSMLPSANVVFSHLTDGSGKLITLVANGGGFGHGVGMSQLGASYMSGQGRPFQQIVQHYYQGVAIGSIPLKVGPKGVQQAERVSFFVDQPRGGVLYVQSDQAGLPVLVELNGQRVSVNTTFGNPINRLAVESLLKAKAQNTILLRPDLRNPSRNVKVWVELYPPPAGPRLATKN